MNDLLLAKVDAWLKEHRQEIIDDLSGLVRIPSVSIPDEAVPPFGQNLRDALDYMYTLGEKHGYTHRDYDHYIGEVIFQEAAEKVGIWAHVDVVPVENPADWDYPPFECTLVEDRYLIGRGVQDNKMAAIGVFHAMNCLRDLGVKLKRGYSLFLGTSEETGMEDARYFAAHYPCPDLSMVPDTGFPVCVAQRGSMTLEVSIPYARPMEIVCASNPSVTPESVCLSWQEQDGPSSAVITGDSCHAYRAKDAKNAVIGALRLLAEQDADNAARLNALAELCGTFDGSALDVACEDELSGALSMAATGLSWADGRLTVRLFSILPVSFNAEESTAKMNAAAEKKGAKVHVARLRKPISFPEDQPVVRRLTEVYNELTGQHSEPFAMSGGNYAAVLPNAFGYGPGMPGRKFPAHIFRPGHGDYHQCDESVDVEQLLAFMRVYVMSLIAVDEMETLK